MKKLIYSDLNKISEDNLAKLKGAFEALRGMKTFSSFLMQELGFRQDAILNDPDLSAEIKVGSLTQISEIGHLFGGGGFNLITQALFAKGKKAPENKKPWGEFKNQAMK